MSNSPFEYERMTNTIGQEIVFYEHPLRGDEATIIVVFPAFEAAFSSDFYDLNDMTEIIDYMPFLINGELSYGYEI